MFTSVGLLFRPSSDHVSCRIKEKPLNRLNVKNGKRFLSLDTKMIKLLKHYEVGETKLV
jgi:hypothetical protein